jgi:hypothetical protein
MAYSGQEPTTGPDLHWLASGFVGNKTLLRDMRPDCCRSCQLIYDGVEHCVPRWMHVDLEHKRVFVNPGSQLQGMGTSGKLLEITLFEDMKSLYLELADFSSM